MPLGSSERLPAGEVVRIVTSAIVSGCTEIIDLDDLTLTGHCYGAATLVVIPMGESPIDRTVQRLS